jgi:hypothetical protein
MMYWRVSQPEEYEQIIAKLKAEEQEKLQLDRQTIDRVIPGEQQPEADHKLRHEGSESGNWHDKAYRRSRAPGWFSYEMRVTPDKPLELYILYWGNEPNRRTFDILIDNENLVTENLAGKWDKDDFISVRYPLSKEMINGKELVTVTFKPQPNNNCRIFDLRIVEAD